jgi:hypothetical protein
VFAWLIVPLRAPIGGACSCEDAECKGKHPHITAYSRRASCDEAVLRDWWDKWPDANVGILTGLRSGVVALDVDPRNGGDDALAELEQEHGPLPITVSAETGGGGQHYYFRAPSVHIGTRKLADGLDLQAERGLLVVPPSLHVSGRRYEWDNPPAEVALAEVPTWLLSRATPRRSRGRSKTLDVIPQGTRNVTLTSIAGAMRVTTPYGEGIEAALHAINRERCRPPLAKSEVARIARSAQRWHSLPWLTSPRQFFADERLDVAARAVLRAICDHANTEGVCWVGHEAIMRLTGIKSPTTVSKKIALLEETGRLRVQRSAYRASLYRISRALPGSDAASETTPVVLSYQNLEAESRGSATA